jgi:hypothetical protein
MRNHYSIRKLWSSVFRIVFAIVTQVKFGKTGNCHARNARSFQRLETVNFSPVLPISNHNQLFASNLWIIWRFLFTFG